jgi:hypothetical protein
VNRVEQLRQAVAQLAAEMPRRLQVEDKLDNELWLQVTAGPYKMDKNTTRYVKLTIEVEDGVPDSNEVERLKAELRQRLSNTKSF